MVGVKGFEPPAPCSQSTYATKLRYTPLDPVAVTAVGFAPDDEIYLTIPASICQHLFSIFPKKLLHLPLTVPPLFFPQDLFKGSPLRGAVRRRAGLKGCPMGRGQGGGLASPPPISAPNQLFELLRCFARLIRQAETPGLQPLRGLHGSHTVLFFQNAHAPGSLRSPSELLSPGGRSNQLHLPRPGKPSPGGVGGGHSCPDSRGGKGRVKLSPICTRYAAAPINYTHQDRVSPPQGVSGAATAAPTQEGARGE